MFKTDLLDKQDRIVVMLLEALYLADGAVSKQKLSQELAVSLSSLNRYIAQLNQLLAPQINAGAVILNIQSNQLELKLVGQVTFDELYCDQAIRNAINYQILMLIYQKGKVTLPEFVFELALSEASLYRHLQQLNSLLAEFKLTIKQGQLSGTELQIRYFYYQLFTLIPITATKQNVLHDQYIRGLEEHFAYQFNAVAAQRIKLWITISRQRQLTITQFDRRLPAAVIDLSRNNVLFDQMSANYRQLFGQMDATAVNFETKALFAMLVGMSVFNSQAALVWEFADIYLHNDTELSQLLTVFNRLLCQSLAIQPEQWGFSFSKALFDTLARPYLFTGELSKFTPKRADYYRQFYFPVEIQRNVEQIIERLKQSTCVKLRQIVLKNEAYFRRCLLLVVDEFEGQQTHELKIGLETDFTDSTVHLLINKLHQYLAGQALIEITPYQPGHDYDLVLTNRQSTETEKSQPIYRFADLASLRDFKNIRKIIIKMSLTEKGLVVLNN
ncbi:helix-turn-helix domain-containing protein [Loigolactobacillus coryniformis]|uniref:helix-turn-helix domain-containing protein n=2 Tax=Loigolactobacillus coryniformis TaxID=1610 RepID=UPI00234184AB|nr:helix-turn-helix domain-containing protein [Loigolactobacillus coryniformis]MDC4184612.1 helix-turn-helix domain-containing protein [Loigolactobacillus coryniformis]